MNTVIVKADLSTAKQYTGKAVYAKVSKKKNQAYFRVAANDFNVSEAVSAASRDNNILAVEYEGTLDSLKGLNFNNVCLLWEMPVGNDVTEEDIQKIVAEVPEGVSILLTLPEDFVNIRFVCDMLDKYPQIRFSGGNLFMFDGYAIGVCGKDLLTKRSIKFDSDKYLFYEGEDSALPVFDESEIELESGQKSTVKSSSSNASKKAKSSKASLFSSLLYGDGKVGL